MLLRIKNFWTKLSGVEQKLLLLFILVLIGSISWLIFRNDRNQTTIPKIGGSYIEGLVGQPQHINPLLAPANDVDADLSRIIYAGLLKFDSNLNLVPDLAESLPQISPNGKEYTLKLKDGLFWHDGGRLTSDDIIFTFQTIQKPEIQSPLRLSWNKVEIEKLDDRTIKITTREPGTIFLANLTVGILPKHIWESVTLGTFTLSKFNLEPMGSGPFQISEIKRKRDGTIREIKLKAYKRYHDGEPYLENLTFKFFNTADGLIAAYHSRDIQGLGYVPYNQNLFIVPKQKLRQMLLPLPQYQAIFINRAKNPAPLEDLRVRIALAKAVNKKKIIEDVYGGQGSEAYGPILLGQFGYNDQIANAEMNVYDPERSKKLLEEAGWIMDPEAGFRKDKLNRIITLSLATNNYSPHVRVAEELKKMWEGIGIKIVLNIETTADLEEKFIRPRNYELLLFSENLGGDPDPYSFWHSSQLRDPGLNLSTFSNKTADRLLIEARGNITKEERATKYRQFQDIFVSDVPAIFISRSAFVYNLPTAIKGTDFGAIVTPSERFADINKWYVETKRVNKPE